MGPGVASAKRESVLGLKSKTTTRKFEEEEKYGRRSIEIVKKSIVIEKL